MSDEPVSLTPFVLDEPGIPAVLERLSIALPPPKTSADPRHHYQHTHGKKGRYGGIWTDENCPCRHECPTCAAPPGFHCVGRASRLPYRTNGFHAARCRIDNRRPRT